MPTHDNDEPGLPEWLKILAILLAIGFLIAVAMLTVGGHRPPSHAGLGAPPPSTSPGDGPAGAGSAAPPSEATRTSDVMARGDRAFGPPTIRIARGEDDTFRATNADAVS